MKTVGGLMIHTGDLVNCYVDVTMYHVMLIQGALGIKCQDYAVLGPKW